MLVIVDGGTTLVVVTGGRVENEVIEMKLVNILVTV